MMAMAFHQRTKRGLCAVLVCRRQQATMMEVQNRASTNQLQSLCDNEAHNQTPTQGPSNLKRCAELPISCTWA